MHPLEKDVRDAGEKYLAAKKAFEAAKEAAAAVGFKTNVQNDGERESIVVTGGPEPEVLVVAAAAPVALPVTETKVVGKEPVVRS